MKPSVFLGCPTHDGRMDQGCATSFFTRASRDRAVITQVTQCMAVATASNVLWADALNARDAVHDDIPDVCWFAMLHSDISPGPYWVDKLIQEAEMHDADLVSAVVPIKCDDGITSTAMTNPDNPLQNWCRLMIRQVNHESFPRTFDADMARDALAALPREMAVHCPSGAKLLLNTGCMVVRLDRPWCEEVWFEQFDRIAKIDGRWQMMALSEDWTFSRKVAERGGKVMASTVLDLYHKGIYEWPSRARDFGWPKDYHSVGGAYKPEHANGEGDVVSGIGMGASS